ncbi:hypothetical protein FISHEDRAFT_78793 [Fistulina hepatica ATCC 64428]|uniref:HNH nuclease domain-containing protein n=1 Tax=Fistulina hepatica ATCC 64428 TaxID=1128425 RepID=A0A0D7A156_9AGAR|nr:hypothetical protein FISHEDRAFT_78793 [Fistulina hepatica ATCC 64428]
MSPDPSPVANSEFVLPNPLPTAEDVDARLKAIALNHEYWTEVKCHIERREMSKTAAVIQDPDARQGALQLHEPLTRIDSDDNASDDGGLLGNDTTIQPSEPDDEPDDATSSTSAKNPNQLDDTKRPCVRVLYNTPPGRAAGRLTSKGRQSLAGINITGMRCSITNTAGHAGVQSAHIIGSATPDNVVSNVERILGIVEGGLNVNTSLNVFFLIQPLHELFDTNRVIVVPTTQELQAVIETFEDTLGKRGRAYANSLLDTIPPALHGHIYEYSYVPLDPPNDVHDLHKLLGRYRLAPDPTEEIRQAKAIVDEDKSRSRIAYCRRRGYQTVSPPEVDHICPFNEPVHMLSQAIPALFALDAARKLYYWEQKGRRVSALQSEIKSRYSKHPAYADSIADALRLIRSIYDIIEEARREHPSNSASPLQGRRNPPRDARPGPGVLEDRSSDIDLGDDDYALYLDGPDDHLRALETESPVAVPGTHNGGPKPQTRDTAFSSSLSPLSSTSSDEDGHDIQPVPSTPTPAKPEAGSRDLSSSPSIFSLRAENRLTPSDEPRGGFGNPTSSFTAGLQAPMDQPNFDAPSSDRDSASPPAHPGSPSTTYSAPYRAEYDDNADGYDALGGPSTGDAVTTWSDHAAGKRRREFTPGSDSDIASELEVPTRTSSARSDLPALKKTRLE